MSETTQTSAQLVCTHEFNAGGVQYSVGDVVAPEAPAAWPEGALETRLANGFLKYKQVTVTVEEAEPGDLITALEAKTKAQLVEYAATLGLELKVDSMTKPDMLLEIVTHIATTAHSTPDAE